MDEEPLLQVRHGRGDLHGEVEEDRAAKCLVVGEAQVVEQVAVGHELGEDVVGGLAGADAEQLHQVRVLHLLHDRRLQNTQDGNK